LSGQGAARLASVSTIIAANTTMTQTRYGRMSERTRPDIGASAGGGGRRRTGRNPAWNCVMRERRCASSARTSRGVKARGGDRRARGLARDDRARRQRPAVVVEGAHRPAGTVALHRHEAEARGRQESRDHRAGRGLLVMGNGTGTAGRPSRRRCR
jgi:hypothetical protein